MLLVVGDHTISVPDQEYVYVPVPPATILDQVTDLSTSAGEGAAEHVTVSGFVQVPLLAFQF